MIVRKSKKWTAAAVFKKEIYIYNMEEGVETEKDRHFCHGYRKLMLLVQLCVLFATRFCSMGAVES